MFTPPLNGHSWVLHVFVEGPVNPETGFVIDFADITRIWKSWIDKNLDHRHLGTIYVDQYTKHFRFPDEWLVPFDFRTAETLYPSSENILLWLASIFVNEPWSKLALEETCTSYAELTREEYKTQKRV